MDVWKNDEKCECFFYIGEIDDDELNRIWMEKDKGYFVYKIEIILYME